MFHAALLSSGIAPGSTVPGATHTITGALTIRGVTRTVGFPGMADNLILDAVVLTVDLAE
jgi:polyisoprenoid-binding protein YceI